MLQCTIAMGWPGASHASPAEPTDLIAWSACPRGMEALRAAAPQRNVGILNTKRGDPTASQYGGVRVRGRRTTETLHLPHPTLRKKFPALDLDLTSRLLQGAVSRKECRYKACRASACAPCRLKTPNVY